MLTRAIKQAWWDFYDSLWRLLLANVAIGVVCLVLFFTSHDVAAVAGDNAAVGLVAAFLLLVVIVPAVAGAWFAGVLHFAGLFSLGQEAGFRDMRDGVKLHFGRVWKVLLVGGLVAFILLGNLWFYATSEVIPAQFALARYALSFLCMWLLLILAGTILHALGLCVRQKMGARRALKMGVALCFALPGLTAGCVFILLGLWIVSSTCQFLGYLLFAFAATAMIVNAAHDAAREWETRLRGDDEEARKRGEETWKLRYERGWREILKPWEV